MLKNTTLFAVTILCLLWAGPCRAQNQQAAQPAGPMAAAAAPDARAGRPAAGERDAGAGRGDTAARRKVQLGDIFHAAGEWDAAVERYRDAAASANEAIAAEARGKLADTLARRAAEPLGLRRYLPPPASHWWLLDYAVLLVLLLFLAAFLKMTALRPLSRALARIVKQRKSTANWRILVTGSAAEVERSLVFDELVVALRGLSALRPGLDEQGFGAAGSGFRQGSFVFPVSLSELIQPGLVVRGFDVGRLASFLQKIRDHYSYRLEVRIDQHAGAPYVFASLRWGALTEEVWQIPTIGTRFGLDFREIGRRLAYDIFGSGMVRQ